MSRSDIDLQLRCSYTPDQGQPELNGAGFRDGARIVTSHDDICPIEFSGARQPISGWRIKSSTTFLKRAQVRPLAGGVHAIASYYSSCYTAEVADSVLKSLDDVIAGELRLRQGLLVAMVGAGVNPLHCHRFWQQLKVSQWNLPAVGEGISLVAVLRTARLEKFYLCRTARFPRRKRIGLMLFGSVTTAPLAGTICP